LVEDITSSAKLNHLVTKFNRSGRNLYSLLQIHLRWESPQGLTANNFSIEIC